MKLIDEQYLKTPAWGSRSMRNHLRRLGYKVNRKRVQRLMRIMGLEAIYPKCGKGFSSGSAFTTMSVHIRLLTI
jgi:putative transposase